MVARTAVLFPAPVAVEEAVPGEVEVDLHPDEEEAIARAIDRRRHEFAAGRACARRAMSALGYAARSLPVGEDRMPRWPDGLVGSISHTRGMVAVAVAPGDRVRSVGLDLERPDRMREALWSRICTDAELERVRALPGVERNRRVGATFSTKECFYKCQYPVSHAWLGFHDVEVELEPDAGRFVARLLVEVDGCWEAGTSFEGRLLYEPDLVASGMTWL